MGCLQFRLVKPGGGGGRLDGGARHTEPSRIEGRQKHECQDRCDEQAPIMLTAIGPQNTLRASGIMASMAANAVRTTGRARRTVLSTIAFQG